MMIASGYYGYTLLVKLSKFKSTDQTEPRFNKSVQTKNNITVNTATVNHSKNIWIPAPQISWQWQLSTPVDQSIDAQMYDIDMFSNDESVVQALHSKGRHVVCYISAGSVEDWRPDAGEFPREVIGKDYTGWPGERWLDIRRNDLIAPIMEKRLDECKAKGFDSVEPDNINGYSQDTGFPLTATDQIKYNIWWADAAHKRGLSIGLKEDPDQANELVSYYDWALDEECFEFGGCEKMIVFTSAGKAVFNTEYGLDTGQFCPEANRLNFNSIRKHKELDAYREVCR
ncbi:MAG: endo alpha-1,4 polygalactosaminidase [Candidatus Saccharimonadales bacterium]